MPFLSIEAFVLAGGKSSRMGSDKGSMPLKGKPMISYILHTLRQIELSVKIIANNGNYDSFGFPVVQDVVEEKGPLGGLLTAFEHTKADAVLLISCDMPFIPEETIRELMNCGDFSTIVAVQVSDRINPLLALYPVSLQEEVKTRISAERLKMTDFILENKHKLVTSGAGNDPKYFRNINTQQELREAEKKMEQLRIKAFGMLAEKLPESDFTFPACRNTEELLTELTKKYPVLESHKFSLSVDQQMVQENTSLKGDEEIALLPPFSGG